MNRQEMFDKAAVGMLRQGKPCWNEYGKCVYGNTEGMHCAVGFLIPEGHPAMKASIGLGPLIAVYPDLSKIFPERTLLFLAHLQGIHDGMDPSNWLAALKDCAREYKLNMKALKEFEQ